MIGYLVNIEFQRMWEDGIICIVSVELDDMTKDCGLMLKILGGGECLKHLVVGQQLHIDCRHETTTVEKAEVAESGYSIGAVITN
jgi:hypothetical protein